METTTVIQFMLLTLTAIYIGPFDRSTSNDSTINLVNVMAYMLALVIDVVIIRVLVEFVADLFRASSTLHEDDQSVESSGKKLSPFDIAVASMENCSVCSTLDVTEISNLPIVVMMTSDDVEYTDELCAQLYVNPIKDIGFMWTHDVSTSLDPKCTLYVLMRPIIDAVTSGMNSVLTVDTPQLTNKDLVLCEYDGSVYTTDDMVNVHHIIGMHTIITLTYVKGARKISVRCCVCPTACYNQPFYQSNQPTTECTCHTSNVEITRRKATVTPNYANDVLTPYDTVDN